MKKLLIIGNCQAQAMAKVLNASTLKWSTTAIPVYSLEQNSDQSGAEEHIVKSVEDTDIILYTRSSKRINGKPVLDIVNGCKKADVPLLTIERAFNDGCFEITDRGMKCSSAPILEKYADWGEQDVVLEYMNDRISFHIHRRFQDGLQKTREYEKNHDIKIADIIQEESLKGYRLFNTYNHPTDDFMWVLTKYIFQNATGEKLPFVAMEKNLFPGRYPISIQEAKYFGINPDKTIFRKHNSDLIRNWHRLRQQQKKK